MSRSLQFLRNPSQPMRLMALGLLEAVPSLRPLQPNRIARRRADRPKCYVNEPILGRLVTEVTAGLCGLSRVSQAPRRGGSPRHALPGQRLNQVHAVHGPAFYKLWASCERRFKRPHYRGDLCFRNEEFDDIKAHARSIARQLSFYFIELIDETPGSAT